MTPPDETPTAPAKPAPVRPKKPAKVAPVLPTAATQPPPAQEAPKVEEAPKPDAEPKPTEKQGEAKGLDPVTVLVLFRKNLELMREHYRKQPESGREMGHLILLELCITDTCRALELAFQGEAWKPVAQK